MNKKYKGNKIMHYCHGLSDIQLRQYHYTEKDRRERYRQFSDLSSRTNSARQTFDDACSDVHAAELEAAKRGIEL